MTLPKNSIRIKLPGRHDYDKKLRNVIIPTLLTRFQLWQKEKYSGSMLEYLFLQYFGGGNAYRFVITTTKKELFK